MSKTARLTPEERKARAAQRRRTWARANPDKIKAYRLNAMRKAALHDILENKALPDEKTDRRPG